MSELKIHTQCCYPLFLRRLLPKTCDFYWKQKKKRWKKGSAGYRNLFLSALGQLDSHIPISSPRFCQQERIKKKEGVVEGLGFGAQGWKAQHITASRQHSSSSTCALILLTWSSYFISFLPFFFPPLHLKVTISAGHWCAVREKDFTTLKEKTRAGKKVTLLHVGKLVWSS